MKIKAAILIIGFLPGIFFPTVGCGKENNPLVGWKPLGSIHGENFARPGEHPPPLDKGILDDYQDFIKKLPVVKTKWGDRTRAYYIMSISFFEDKTGQHAVAIFAPFNGDYRYYILFYDKTNRRTKVTKYSAGHYSS